MHRIDDSRVAYAWDRATPPVLTVAPGESVEITVREASDGQLTASSTVEDLATIDADRANPVTGPVAVEGARPGDTLVVHIEDVGVVDWGWSAVIADLRVREVVDALNWLVSLDIPVAVLAQ